MYCDLDSNTAGDDGVGGSESSEDSKMMAEEDQDMEMQKMTFAASAKDKSNTDAKHRPILGLHIQTSKPRKCWFTISVQLMKHLHLFGIKVVKTTALT